MLKAASQSHQAEVFRFEPGKWIVLGVYAKSAKVRAEPFSEIELDLGLFWLE